MEHFSTAKGNEIIDIPYLCTYHDHDDGTFMSYPLRRGWSDSPIIKHSDLVNRSSLEISVFFQAWLYFGCLKEVFEVVGLQVQIEKFVRATKDEKYITTSLLPALIEKWRDQEKSPENIPIGVERYDARNALWATMVKCKAGRRILISSILSTVQHNINQFCDDKISQESFPTSQILSKVLLSIIALGWTLQRAALAIYESSESPNQRWGSLNPILKERLLQAGWCYSDIKKLTELSNIAALYCLGSSRSSQMYYDHSRCTEARCYASKDDIYQLGPNHVLPCCSCEPVSVSSDILDIIEEGKIPCLSWDESENKLIIHEYKVQSKTKYIAISHVWSDGLGNPRANSLPMCQLRRIQKLVDDLCLESQHAPQNKDGSASNEVIGTTDSLRQPMGFWIDTLCVPIESKKHRKITILRTGEIFKAAHAVLVLDSLVQNISYSADITTKALGIYSCKWTRGQWALEEGTLAQTLFYQFRDRAQTLQDLKHEQKIEENSCPGFYCRIAGLILPLLVMDLKENLPLPLRFLSALTRTSNRADLSKLSDETLLLCGILDLDSASLINIRLDFTDQKSVAEVRMEIFLKMIQKFPAEIIFNTAPKLRKEGFRWAPTSFLQYRLKLPGPEVASRDYKREKFAILNPDQGLVVTFPGIVFESVVSIFSTPFSISLDDHHRVYHITIPSSEDVQGPCWNSGRYGIVVNGSEGIYPEKADAIIGILDLEETSESLRLIYLSRIKIELFDLEELRVSFQGAGMAENEKAGLLFGGKWVQDDQKWCVC